MKTGINLAKLTLLISIAAIAALQNSAFSADKLNALVPVSIAKTPECVNLAQVKNLMVYPPKAVEEGIEGSVTVNVLVGPDGKVVLAENLCGPNVFYDEVMEKSMMLQFTPGLMNGRPVWAWVSVPFVFRLNGK